LRRPEALRHPLHDLLRRSVGDDPGHAESGAEDGKPDAGVAPEQFLVADGHRESSRVGKGVLQEFERVKADLGRLLDNGPRRLFPLVPFMSGGTDDVLGETMNPVLHLPLVFV
jgi:hypothetical protein